MRSIRSGSIKPAIQSRDEPIDNRRSNIQLARERLHVSAVPKSLPCRETEFSNIFSFVEGKILDQCGGYVDHQITLNQYSII